MMLRPAIYAHRGVSQNARENTIQAFELALEMGVDGIELDIWKSRDGHLIVHHDPDVNGIPIRETKASELPSFVPTLPEALDVCSELRVNIEIKSSDHDRSATSHLAELLVETLRCRPEPVDRWLISSFDHDVMDRISDKAPEFQTGLLIWEKPWRSVLLRANDQGHCALHPHESLVDETMVQAARENELKLNVWTVNDVQRAGELANFGVEALITDIPDDIMRELDAAT